MKNTVIVLLSLSIFAFSCGDDDSATTNDFGNPEDLPASILGSIANMELSTSATSDHPYSLNQKVNFTFSSSGALFIDTDPDANNGEEIQINNFTISGSEFIWADETFQYALSMNGDEINEINLNSANGGTFHGQFTPITTTQGNLVASFEGTYSVTSVDQGSHSRMTVSIDSDGNIDFDTNTSFSSENYELVTDRRDCCDGIWVDMTPYPSEPYPRAELYVNASGNLSAIHYYPEYPNVTGRVQINF